MLSDLLAISRLSSFVGPINWSDPYFQDNGYFRPRTNSDIKYESLNPFGVIKEVLFDKVDVTGDVEEKVTRYRMCYTLIIRFFFSRENFKEVHIYFDKMKVHDVKQVPVYASEKDTLCKYSVHYLL